MRILTAGGGSGGHVTPVVAVLEEIKKAHPEAEVQFWCDKKFEQQARKTVGAFDDAIAVHVVPSGKFRRYHKLPLWRQMTRLRTIVLPNLIDAGKVVAGIVYSWVRMVRWKPDVVFTKGGFVCVPIGIAARLHKIPLVIHDSDAHPGLANRILARWAQAIATGAPLKYYSYPKSCSHYVGIPIKSSLQPPTLQQQRALKKKLGLTTKKPLVVITGGGLGATRVNEAAAAALTELREMASVVLISGAAHYDALRAQLGEDADDFQLHGFVAGTMLDYLAAADVVVTRAGMTVLAEVSALARPTVLIPNAYLTGGHQLKNARVYADVDAAIIVDEEALDESPRALVQAVHSIVESPARAAQLSKAIAQFARPDAATDVAQLVIAALPEKKA